MMNPMIIPNTNPPMCAHQATPVCSEAELILPIPATNCCTIHIPRKNIAGT